MIELLASLRQDDRLAQMTNKLWEGTKNIGKNLKKSTAQIDIGMFKVHLREHTDVQENWALYGEKIIELLEKGQDRPLLMIDEFPIMVHHIAQHNIDELRRLMRWFRSARLTPKAKTRFLLGGSINLMPTLDAIGLIGTVNDLAIEKLGPFDDETAFRFIKTAITSQKMVVGEGVIQHIVDIIGTHVPYLLSVLVTSLFDRQRTKGKPITNEMVDDVFSTELLSRATPFFNHYYRRLQDYYAGDEVRQAKVLLSLLSRAAGPVQRDTLYQEYLRVSGIPHTSDALEKFLWLMQKLENDFYVSLFENKYDFSNRTIKLWWQTNYGYQFV